MFFSLLMFWFVPSLLMFFLTSNRFLICGLLVCSCWLLVFLLAVGFFLLVVSFSLLALVFFVFGVVGICWLFVGNCFSLLAVVFFVLELVGIYGLFVCYWFLLVGYLLVKRRNQKWKHTHWERLGPERATPKVVWLVVVRPRRKSMAPFLKLGRRTIAPFLKLRTELDFQSSSLIVTTRSENHNR